MADFLQKRANREFSVSRVFISIAVAVLILVALLSYENYNSARNSALEKGRQELFAICSQASFAFKDAIEKTLLDQIYIGKHPVFGTHDEEALLFEMQNRFEELLSRGFSTIQVADSDGIVWGGYPKEYVIKGSIFENVRSMDISLPFEPERVWAQVEESMEPYVSDLLITPSLETEGFFMMTPIENETGDFGGAIFTSFTVEEIQRRYIEPLAAGVYAKSFLLSAEGKTVYDQNNVFERGEDFKDALSTSRENEIFIKAIEEGKPGNYEITVRGGENFIVAQSPISLIGSLWIVGLAKPSSDITSDLTSFTLRQLAMGVLISIVLLLTVITIMGANRKLAVAGERAQLMQSLEEMVEKRTEELESATESLNEVVAKLYSIVENPMAGVVIVDSSRHIQYANKYARERFGEIEGMKCSSLLLGESATCNTCELQDEDCLKPTDEQKLMPADHDKFYEVYSTSFIARGGEANVIKLIVDVTEKKKMSDQLENYAIMLESKVVERTDVLEFETSKIKAVLEGMAEGVVLLDGAGNLIEINREAEEYIGSKRDSVFGLHYRDIFSFQLAESVERAITVLKSRKGDEMKGDVRIGWNWFSVRIKSVDESTERLSGGIIINMTDITSRKRLEEELVKRNRELALINELTATLTGHLNPEGALDLAFGKMREVLDFDSGIIYVISDKEEAIKSKIWKGFGKTDREEWMRIMLCDDDLVNACIKTGELKILFDKEPDDSVFKNLMKEEGLNSGVVVPLRAKEAYIGIIFMGFAGEHGFRSEDISLFNSIGATLGIALESAKLLNSLEEANVKLKTLNMELEEANRLKSEFLANTSHELRTPLNSILGFLRLVMDGIYEDSQELNEFVKNAYNSSRHLLDLINDILDIAKIEAGKAELFPVKVEISDVFGDTEKLTRIQAEQKKLSISFDVEQGLKSVFADYNKLKQVMLNLVGNAVKFTDKGSVRVSASNDADESHVRISVKDTGIGISADEQKRLFSKFTQANQSGGKRGGTGLGLIISKSLVEMMGGRIWLHSDGQEKGTAVAFTVPIFREMPVAESVYTPQGNMPKALVVENDAEYTDYLKKLLEMEGYEVIWADTADEALSIIEKENPEIVTVDIGLPRNPQAVLNDGIDVLAGIERSGMGDGISALIISGQSKDEINNRMEQEGVKKSPDILIKPVMPDEVREALRRTRKSKEEGSLTVIIVDDDEKTRRIIKSALEAEEIRSREAANGKELIEIIRNEERNFDVIILDMPMPVMSGDDVLNEMEGWENAKVPGIIVLTDYPEKAISHKKKRSKIADRIQVLEKSEIMSNSRRLIDEILRIKQDRM